MATTVAALKGKLGTTEYYVLAMKAQELVNTVHIPSEIEGWHDLSIEERYQRDINNARVKKQIAPYIANDPDRFFGSIIVAATNLGHDQFEPLPEMATTELPRVYRAKSSGIGFLTFDGNETMFPLDGQHRLRAIKFALLGKDERGNDIDLIERPARELADENITVIVVPFEPEKARKIFTKVNKYAKKTSPGENLVTEDDDVIAVLSRETSNQIGGRLVKYVSSTLTARDIHFTTLNNLAECNARILEFHLPDPLDRKKLPEPALINRCKQILKKEWGALLSQVDLFRNMLQDKSKEGDDKRREIRRDYLLGKPIPQKCLITAYLSLTLPKSGVPISSKQAIDNLNKIPWEHDDERWDGLLVRGTKLLYKNADISSRIIAYWAGSQLSASELQELEEKYVKLFPKEIQEKKKLPEPVV